MTGTPGTSPPKGIAHGRFLPGLSRRPRPASNFSSAGVGVVPTNAYVLRAEQPVLVDTGMAVDRAEFLAALSCVVDPRAVRWVWLTHEDADHTGDIEAVSSWLPGARRPRPPSQPCAWGAGGRFPSTGCTPYAR